MCESDLAFRADKAAHVLHHPDDRHLNLLTESDLLSHVLQRYLLDRRGNRNHRKRKAKARAEVCVYVWVEMGSIRWTGRGTHTHTSLACLFGNSHQVCVVGRGLVRSGGMRKCVCCFLTSPH